MFRAVGSSVIVAAVLAACSPAASSPVLGDWAVTLETPQGSFESTMTVAEEGGGYSVSFVDPPNPNFPPPESDEITDVVVDGSSFSFTRTVGTPQGPIELAYTGTIDGDTLTGEANSAFGAIPIAGTRK